MWEGLFSLLRCLQIPSGSCLKYFFADNSTNWLPNSLVYTFGVLTSHFYKNRSVVFVNAPVNYTGYTIDKFRKDSGYITEISKEDPYLKDIVALVLGYDHFVVMHFRIPEKRITVYDGLSGNDLTKWNNSSLVILWRYGLISVDDSSTPCHCLESDHGIHRNEDLLTMAHDSRMKGLQKDSHSCGILASLAIIHLIRPVSKNQKRGKTYIQADVPKKHGVLLLVDCSKK